MRQEERTKRGGTMAEEMTRRNVTKRQNCRKHNNNKNKRKKWQKVQEYVKITKRKTNG